MKANIRRYISIRKDFCHGRPLFRRTRIPVSLILHMLEGGDSIEAILDGYPSLSREAIQAGLHLAGELVDDPELSSRAKASQN